MRTIPSLMFAALAALPLAAGETPPSRAFRFVYSAGVKEIPDGARSVRVWVPLPVDLPEQTVSGMEIKVTAGGATVTKPLEEVERLTEVGGVALKIAVRPIQHGGGKTLCIESAGQPFSLETSFDVVRRETSGGGSATAEELAHFVGADKMIPLDKKVGAIAGELPAKGDATATARTLYDHVLEQMKYDKPEGGAWGRGDSEWACDSHYGNCTDFHSYFMGLARAKRIPARFEMGFSIPGGTDKEAKVGGYHCWAYFWAEGRGWVPVDISEADKRPEKAEYFFGNLDADRFTMTTGRDLVVDPAPACGTLNFLVYPYCEVDGKEHKGIDKSFLRILK